MKKLMKFFIVLVTILAAVTATLSVAQATEAPVLERIVKSGTMRVGLSGDQPPYNATSRGGELIGLEVDLANLLAGAFGVKVEFVKKPFPELMAALKASEVDIVMSGMAITPERSIDAAFVGPYLLSGKSILTNSNTLAAIKEAGQINRANLKLAALENSTRPAFRRDESPRGHLRPHQGLRKWSQHGDQ